MNESEIRERLRAAVGEASFTEDLSARVEARLNERLGDQPHPRALGLVAALIAIAVVAALFAPRLLTHRVAQLQPAAPQAASGARQSSPAAPQGTPVLQVTDGELDSAQLSGLASLVTPLQFEAQIGNRQIALIGAYADPAHIVLFFRTGDSWSPMVSVNDEYGFLNASSSGAGGANGVHILTLDAGPRYGPDGFAHLKVNVAGLYSAPPDQSFVQANVNFSFAVRVQPSIPLVAATTQYRLGSWTVTLEAMEVTPSVVHLAAVVDGASLDDLGPSFMTLLDPTGKEFVASQGGGSVTVPKQQLNSTTVKRSRINYQWVRPATAGTYHLHFAGNGGQVSIPLDIPAPNKAATGKGGGLQSIQPTDFPSAQESMTLSGTLAATITTGRPSMCGAGTGPDGTIFAFATYFQVGATWYWLEFTTAPTAPQYHGPGTYRALAWLYTVGPDGPSQPLLEGSVQLTVASDSRPDSGSVQGTLTGLEVIAPQSQVTISGSWTCVPGPNLGPG
jgi:hypothetical protein